MCSPGHRDTIGMPTDIYLDTENDDSVNPIRMNAITVCRNYNSSLVVRYRRPTSADKIIYMHVIHTQRYTSRNACALQYLTPKIAI